jgi:CheY-like chemotaxis protein
VSEGPAAAATASVLIADDDPSVLQVLALAFRNTGYSVETAENGTVGIEMVDSKRYDLLVLDILMPGATGWEVHAKALEAVPPGKPLPRAILMTGFQQEYVVDFRALQQEGVGAMLLKPFPASTILDEAARLLGEPPPVLAPHASRAATA